MGQALSITGVNVWSVGSLVACSDTLAREEPLEIQLNGNPLTRSIWDMRI